MNHKAKWMLGEKHEVYGTVVMLRRLEGEEYRWFEDEHGTISMFPLDALNEEIKEKEHE